MPRRLNKSSRYFLQHYDIQKKCDDPNLTTKCRGTRTYVKPENAYYRKGMPTIPQFTAES